MPTQNRPPTANAKRKGKNLKLKLYKSITHAPPTLPRTNTHCPNSKHIYRHAEKMKMPPRTHTHTHPSARQLLHLLHSQAEGLCGIRYRVGDAFGDVVCPLNFKHHGLGRQGCLLAAAYSLRACSCRCRCCAGNACSCFTPRRRWRWRDELLESLRLHEDGVYKARRGTEGCIRAYACAWLWAGLAVKQG